MAENDTPNLKDDPRLSGENVNDGNHVTVNDAGVASAEDLGDGLAKVTDRDGRVSVQTIGATDAANLTPEQRQKAVDVAIENSPVDPELSPGHSNFDPNKTLASAPDKVEGENVVNADLGVDKNTNASKSASDEKVSN